MRTKVAYLHDNPRRKGLVHEAPAWRFSSAAYWLQEPPGKTDVVLCGGAVVEASRVARRSLH